MCDYTHNTEPNTFSPRSSKSYLRAKGLVDHAYKETAPIWFSIPAPNARLMDFTLSFIKMYCQDKFHCAFTVIPCYNMGKIIEFDSEAIMEHSFCFEIPYGTRSAYVDLLFTFNNEVELDGTMMLFVNNNPYNLQAMVVIVTKSDETAQTIQAALKEQRISLVYDKGLPEFAAELQARKWDFCSFNKCNRQSFLEQFNHKFWFSEKSALLQKGYDNDFSVSRPSIFISYCHSDKAVVYDFTERLESCGMNFWIDKKDLESGKPLLRSILERIAKCDIAISFISKAMAQSDFAQAELDQILTALTKKQKTWCFVRLDDVNVDSVMPGLSSYFYIDYASEPNIDLILDDVLKKYKRLHELKLNFSSKQV